MLQGQWQDLVFGFYAPWSNSVDGWTYVLMHSKSPRNYWHINDPNLDKLLEAQRKEADATKRRDILRQIWQMEMDNIWRIPPPMTYAFGAHSARLHGVLPTDYIDPRAYGNALWEVAWVDK